MSGISRNASLLVLTGLIATFALAFYQLLQPYLLPLFLASILSILVRPLYDYLRSKMGNRQKLAGTVTILLLLTVFFLPIVSGLMVGSVELLDWSQNLLSQIQIPEQGAKDNNLPAPGKTIINPAVEKRINEFVDQLNHVIAPRKIEHAHFRTELWKGLQSTAESLAKNTPGMLGTIASFLVASGVVILGLYFFLVDGDKFVLAAENLFPLQVEYQRIVCQRFVTVTRAVVLGTFLAAIAQGLATGIALRIAGFPQLVMLTVLATLAAIIPFAGTALIWGPCVIWLAITDWQANLTTIIILSLFQLIVVGLLDNFVRAIVLNSDVKLHPLLAFLSVLGGLQWMGLWGIFIGPLIASCLHALMEILRQELYSQARENGASPPNPPAG